MNPYLDPRGQILLQPTGYRVFDGELLNAIIETVNNMVFGVSISVEEFHDGPFEVGDDITKAWQAAIDAARARVVSHGGLAKVILPAGDYFNLTAQINIPSGVWCFGAGSLLTRIRRIGNFNSVAFGVPDPGTSVEDSGIAAMCIYHDYGNGLFPSLVPSSWINPVNANYSHIIAYTPTRCGVLDVQTSGLPYAVQFQGGAGSWCAQLDTIGVWDPNHTEMQACISALVVDQDPALTASIPTYHRFVGCRLGGWTRTATVVPYPGGHSKVATQNIGPQSNVLIKAGEQITFDSCYTGAASKSAMILRSRSGRILAGVFITGHFFDPCGTADEDGMLKFENEDTGGQIFTVSVVNSGFFGQTNGWRAISDVGSTATYGSVTGLSIFGCNIANFVGNPCELTNARRVTSFSTFAAYNCEDYYTGDRACAAHIGAASRVINFQGILGGGINGETATGTAQNRCIDGVRADDYLASRVKVGALDGGLSGSLFVGPPPPVMQLGNANLAFVYGTHSPTILQNTELTGDKFISLGVGSAQDGDIVRVTRTSAGLFNLLVGSTNLATNEWCEYICFSGAFDVLSSGPLL